MPPTCTEVIFFNCVCWYCVCVLEVNALLATYPDFYLSWIESQAVILREVNFSLQNQPYIKTGGMGTD